jgi:hypothetical protein
VVEVQDEVLKKNFSSQPLAGTASHDLNANTYNVRKPQFNKRGKKGKEGTQLLQPGQEPSGG